MLMTVRRTAMLLVSIAPLLAAQRPATFAGRAFADTILRPIAGVEVTIPDLNRTTTTDDKGAFRFDSIPPGPHQVRARKIGYASFEATIYFDRAERVEKGIVLPRLSNLDTVVVVGESNAPLDFLEHRAIGLGHFMTRADLEKAGARRMTDVLAGAPGVGVHRQGNKAWVLSKRSPATIQGITRSSERVNNTEKDFGGSVWFPDDREKRMGMKAGCYARVYLDKALLNATNPAHPVDLSEFAADQLEAVEWFATAAQTPPDYNKLNSACGVLVLHTRKK